MIEVYITLAILVGYVLPGYLWWKYISIAHSKGGRWECIRPDNVDKYISFIPIVNLFGTLIFWASGSPSKINKEKQKLQEIRNNKFFKIKK